MVLHKLFLLSFLIVSITTYAQETNKVLSDVFSDIEKFENNLNPQDSLYRGVHIKGAFRRLNEASFRAESEQYQEFISRLIKIPDDNLSRQEYISKRVMMLRLENAVSSVQYQMYLIPMDAEGGFYLWINYALSQLPFNDEQDYQNYLSWLPSYVMWLEDYLKLIQIGIDEGIVAPQVVIKNNLKLLEAWVVDDFSKNPFYQPFDRIPESWDQKVSHELRQKAKEMITKKIIPAYKKIEAFLRTDYLSASPNEPGVMYLTGGKAYYEDRVRYYTTLPITPDSIHQVGLQEVARIKSQMVNVIKKIGFEGSFEEFLTHLRTDEQFYAKTPQELLNRAAWLSKKSEEQLPKLFNKLYSLPFTVSPVPAEIAPTYTGGRYSEGSWKQQRAGAYWVNTYDLKSRPLYTLPSLTLHEAVPGHHLQISIAQELTGLPDFRTNYYISAFGEGWGLYSEYLGEEMGIYETPFELFGRYTYEMWRACRLVVDTGIHYKGWSREKAFEYLKSNTALSLHEVNTEIDRYIGWPGQAVSYKMGELKIKSLRKQAEEQLGPDFDIREFHNHVLKNGSIPLSILEEEIEKYIETTLESK
jgi:uncharacterized protein (DUF885 family)